MKRLLLMGLAMMFASAPVFAAEETDNATETTTKKTHNMLNGHDTTTKTTKHKMKDANGARHKSKVEESKTTKPDGGTDKSTTKTESDTPAD